MKHFVAAKNVLGVRTNLPALRWSFGMVMPDGTPAEYNECAVKLTVGGIHTERPQGLHAGHAKYHYFSGLRNGDSVSYRRGLLPGVNLALDVAGIAAGAPVVTCNRSYRRFVQHRFMNLHSLGYILTDIAAYVLLRTGYAPLHCSAVAMGDEAVIVFAPPNTGKTLTCMMAMEKYGAEYCSEDLAITDGHKLHAVPWTNTYRYYRKSTNMFSRFRQRLVRAIPLCELIPDPSQERAESFRTNLPIKAVAVLNGGSNGVRDLARDEALRMVSNLNRYEFCYTKAPILNAYEFLNDSVSIDAARIAETEILGRMLDTAGKVISITSDNPLQYADMLMKALDS